MDKIRCIAVDDEPLALDIIENYIEKIPFLELEARFDGPLEAMDYLKQNKIDILFLDIQMDELTGLQMLELIQNKPYIILTTAYSEYALKGYELEVTDYLVKPISFDRFYKSVSRIQNMISAPKEEKKEVVQVLENTKSTATYFFVKTEFRVQKVEFSKILYIEGKGDYLQIVCESEKIMTLMSFKQVSEILPSDEFVRVHKSYMVAIEKIESIERNRIKIGEEQLQISETYKKDFYDLLRNKGVM